MGTAAVRPRRLTSGQNSAGGRPIAPPPASASSASGRRERLWYSTVQPNPAHLASRRPEGVSALCVRITHSGSSGGTQRGGRGVCVGVCVCVCIIVGGGGCGCVCVGGLGMLSTALRPLARSCPSRRCRPSRSGNPARAGTCKSTGPRPGQQMAAAGRLICAAAVL